MGWSKIEKEDFVLTKVLYRGRSSNETVKAMTTEFDPKAEEEKVAAESTLLSLFSSTRIPDTYLNRVTGRG